MRAAFRFNRSTPGRIYCGLIAMLLIGLGLSTWSDDRANLFLGAILCGVGVFMSAGLFGRPARVLAMLGLCVAFSLLSFAFSLGLLVLHGEAPSTGTLTVWAIELSAGSVAATLARSLYRDVVG